MVNFINRLVGATLVIALIESGRSQGSPLRKKQYNYNLKVRTKGALIYLRDSRNSETLSGWQRIFFLLCVTTVKKYVLPFVRALRYRMILMLLDYCWVSFLNPTYNVFYKLISLPAHQL